MLPSSTATVSSSSGSTLTRRRKSGAYPSATTNGTTGVGGGGGVVAVDADSGARDKVQRELLSSELSYGVGLRVLIHEYLMPLRTGKKLLVKERDVECIFLNINDIASANRGFELQLQAAAEDARDAGPGNACFAAAFSSAIPKFRCYGEFASAWTSSLALFTKLKKNNKPFSSFIASVDAARPAGNGFDQLLSTPLGRMAFYESTLSKLASLTHDVDERARLQVAYKEMRELQSYFGEVNNQKFNRETLTKVAARIREYDGELVIDSRQYLYEGPLPISSVDGTLMPLPGAPGAALGGVSGNPAGAALTGSSGSSAGSGGGGGGIVGGGGAGGGGAGGGGGGGVGRGASGAGAFKTDPDEDYFFLFSDALMYTHAKGKDSFKFKVMLPIETMRIKNVLDSERQKSAFQISARGLQFTLACADSTQKQAWIDHLRAAINTFHKHKVFGVDLEVLLLRENERRAADHALRRVPAFLEHAFAFLAAHSLDVVGLFRLSANQDELESMRDCINLGAEYEYSPRDPHVAAGLIKLFFRELPQPLVQDSVRYACEKLLANSPDDAAVLAPVRDALHQLPEPNRSVLRELLRFLHKVAERSEMNKMTSSNLGVVFGPNLFTPREDTMYSRDERNVKFFVDHVHELFPGAEPPAPAAATATAAAAAAPVPAPAETATSPRDGVSRSTSMPANLADASSGKKTKALGIAAPSSVAPTPSALSPRSAAQQAQAPAEEDDKKEDAKKKKRHGDRESRRQKE